MNKSSSQMYRLEAKRARRRARLEHRRQVQAETVSQVFRTPKHLVLSVANTASRLSTWFGKAMDALRGAKAAAKKRVPA